MLKLEVDVSNFLILHNFSALEGNVSSSSTNWSARAFQVWSIAIFQIFHSFFKDWVIFFVINTYRFGNTSCIAE